MVWQMVNASAIRLATTLGLLVLIAGCMVDVVDPDRSSMWHTGRLCRWLLLQ